ncbi:MAG: hypothetical protein U5K00_21195 [Melioribacteraceae bacterium]|nr:hypothetical protein [Melioribacteraceae bacterium]
MQRTFLALLLIVLILVSCKLKEDVTDPDEDPTEGDITLTFPNGKDSLMVGANYDILWNSSIQSSLVLEYSIDNGSSWKTISDSVANTGTFTWGPVPNTLSSRCYMRIRTSDGATSDRSDTTWSIIENVNKVLLLTAPSGGEVVQQGGSIDIEWISSKVQSVKIEFSTDNGNTWETIITNFDASLSKYTWKGIPAINSTQCLIRISDVSSSTVSDVMPSTFSIIIDSNLMLLSPNGGEEVEGGTEFEVKWYSSKEISEVNLEYTTNNGFEWQTIVNNFSNRGIYYWEPVPSTPTTLAKLRITDVDNLDNSDESDTTFTILPEANINITSPTPGERWQTGDKKFITWTSKNVAQVSIEYSTNNGSDWKIITQSTESDGSYLWEPIPSHNSSLCNIRISDASDGKPSTIMSETFTIYTGEEVLEVYTPNGGENWEIGTEQEITWFAEKVTGLKIEYTTNNGQTWTTIENSVANTGSYFWSTIPNTPSKLAKVRLTDAGDGEPSDISDAPFTISQESQITVTAPNGGEQLQAGSSTNITWTSANIEFVKIEFSSNGGATWGIVEESIESRGLYQWEDIPDVSSQQCLIKISDASDGIPADVSDGNFTITNEVVETISIIEPTGTAEWKSGTQQAIAWSSSGIDSVKIEYSLNNGGTWLPVIETFEAGIGGYTWNPVVDVDDFKRNSKIRVSDAEDGKPFAESQAFTIKPVPAITVTAPNGGEEYENSESFPITWTSIGIEKVTIEITPNNGVSWDTLAHNLTNRGEYATSLSIASDEYKVRVRNSIDEGYPFDESDGTFTVLPKIVKTITVTRPNGGEDWLTSKDPNNPNYHEIRWTSNNIEQVNIQYSLDGGASMGSILKTVKCSKQWIYIIGEFLKTFNLERILLKLG